MRYGLFVMVLLFGLMSYSKNRVLFTMANSDPKKLPDLYVLTDYKKGESSKRFIETEILNYSSADEFIVYMTKDRKMFVVKDFDSYGKNLIAEVVSYRVHQNRLYYEVMLNGQKTLFVITDFRSLSPIQIMQNYASYGLDE
ncbi:MAG: hypothetical protein K2P92_07915 [Bdellovibrionaceae bacterium]|nr:hypothetical protein [Pseudobdellovibrionaceae bacterium]